LGAIPVYDLLIDQMFKGVKIAKTRDNCLPKEKLAKRI
jgi:hypothetical protein